MKYTVNELKMIMISREIDRANGLFEENRK